MSRIFYRMLTLLTVMLGWILFRAIGLRRAISYVLSIIGANDNPLHGNITNLYLKENIFVLLIAIIIATPILPNFKKNLVERNLKKTKILTMLFEISYQLILLILFFVVVSYLVKGSYNPFIYFNF